MRRDGLERRRARRVRSGERRGGQLAASGGQDYNEAMPHTEDTMVAGLIELLRRRDELSAVERERMRSLIGGVAIEEGDVEPLVAALVGQGELDEAWLKPLLEGIARACDVQASRPRLAAAAGADVAELYRRLGRDSKVRHLLLRLLAVQNNAAALDLLAELLVTDGPSRGEEVLVALAPLFQRADGAAAAMFPRLWDALAQPALAAAVVDLANFLTRQRGCEPHAAAARVDQLAALLGALCGRLGRIEEQPQEFASSPEELTRQVNEAVALIVALCDALALVGQPSVSGKLYQAMELSHRRVRTEAAAALARLGDEQGIATLAAMAAEPLVRSRALAYLEELGLGERAEEQFRSPAARAEGDLAAWMAAPTRFGLPPQRLDLIDHRRQYWPGLAEPVECYLFRYEYHLQGLTLANVAIAGPLTSAVAADLLDLPPGDIYAVFAGLDAMHGEIAEKPADALSGEEQRAWESIREDLLGGGYEQPRLARIGHFFGEDHAVVAAVRNGQPGIAVVSREAVEWFPTNSATSRPLGASEVYALYKGRRLLGAFNP